MSEAVRYDVAWTKELDKKLLGRIRPDLRWGSLRRIGYIFGPPSVLLCVAVLLRLGAVVGREGFIALIAGAFLGFLVERFARRLFRPGSELERIDRETRSGEWNLSAEGLDFENEMLKTSRSWALVTGLKEEDWGILVWIGPAVIPLPDNDLLTNVDRAEALRRIIEWRGAQ